MAIERPRFIDLSDQRPALRRNADDQSPRIQHMDGDIPPALSPLDAFAAHSRRLARELEETRGTGERRMSRLPPQHVTKSLGELKDNRPAIFRQLSSDHDWLPSSSPVGRQNSGPTPQYAQPSDRHKSYYVHLSSLQVPRDQSQDNDGELFYTPTQSVCSDSDALGIPRSQSPAALDTRTSYEFGTDARSDFSLKLMPPNPAFVREAYHESSEDEYASSNNGSTFSQTRKLSSSSGVSAPHSPASPYRRAHQRSPSAQSVSSISTPVHKQHRPRVNFSRPISASSLHNLMQHSHLAPTRQDSATSQGSLLSPVLPCLPTPSTSFDEERSLRSDGLPGEAFYSQTTNSLPRGRQSEGTSVLFPDSTPSPLEWKEPSTPHTPPLDGQPSLGRPSQEGTAPGTPSPLRHAQSPLRPSVDVEPRAMASSLPPPATPEQPTSSQAISSTTPLAELSMPPPMVDLASSTDTQSNSTIRPATARVQNDYQALSADDHVTKAIDLHEHGDLKESTYHLRIAAKQNHPTGMLLYALACRHGWGMRPNPTEGVYWLRKAVDVSQLEVAEDENPSPAGNRRQADFIEKKAHRAQFALSVYELGQCHLNGWGMEMDKALALRCFEMAGTWGDVDALTEAGFCYAQGIGCKKDLKKAAKWYREAEKKGANMVGNSWIHKDKYNDNDDKKTRSGKPSTPSNSSADEVKLVLVTRTDLGMTKGKIAAQCGHATLACYKALAANPAHRPLLRRWEGAGQPKIALQAKGGQDQLETLQGRALSLGLCARVIRDAGRTQIEAGSMTVLGILGPKSVVDQVTGDLKLL
ncbi:hypothetical protein DV735_g1033, partial [Chaetothyriales sp. CBS 134920]